MEFAQADDIVGGTMSEKISGHYREKRNGVPAEMLVSGSKEPRGVSGNPLRAPATSFVRYRYRADARKLPIIYEKLKPAPARCRSTRAL